MFTIAQLGNHIISALITFTVLIVLAAGVAYVAARALGGKSRVRRQIAFAAVGGVGLIGAAVVTFTRLRGHL